MTVPVAARDIFNSDVKTAYDSIKRGFGSASAVWGPARYLGGRGSWLQDFAFLSRYLTSKSEAMSALG